MRYFKLIPLALILVFGLMACSEKFDMPGNTITGPGQGPQIQSFVGFDLNALAQHAIDAGYPAGYLDSLSNMLQDVPDTAWLYVVGLPFPNGRAALCQWSEVGNTVQIPFWYWKGLEFKIRLEVDNRVLTEGITIRSELLTHTIYDGAEPYVNMWNHARLDAVPGYPDSIEVEVFGDNLAQMVSVFTYYDGWANWLPDSLQHLNGPLASPDYPARFQSSLFALLPDSTTHTYWNPQINCWALWARALPTGSINQFWTIVFVTGQPIPNLYPPQNYPNIRLTGVNLNNGELWCIPNNCPPAFPYFVWGLNGENLNQGPNTTLVWLGSIGP
ncbi:MAG: hypothetical protein COY66_05480 [Candidatus Kerfeldbacteria bacterium CG_4_10_14_0_8_um_filter_42_10]|uniref:Uncharacterized protein n=1 Tax=Candidatus Kerfeldbacteria bacterium CG_4_10_14_0_8_um_filter_42_10 TaxID=2014248 RepID=A0A2M7RGT3_9BACT|nr:MAG: hypothetical protein COY66_05480 [Candidatus Kerfeldbacteria bacterium CG_4_10_14_0_8_um_filter_42_10]